MAKNQFSNTLNLPKTEFPMRAGLPKREPAWLQRWLDEDIYGKLRAKRMAQKAEKFILHLGPPYANGHMHMGHAMTYTLKDFIVRSKFMMGFDSPYVPGWDCHGLPIEWKVEQEIRDSGKTKYDFSVQELRAKCRAYAQKWVDIQKKDWQRFGCIGDWDNPYLTMSRESESGIVKELGKLLCGGLLYKGLRSTMWSTVEETAMAEAEVEYQDKKSTAIYVKFPIVGGKNEFVVIWTTTPWTIPANRAIAYGADVNYVALKVEATQEESLAKVGETYWVAAKLQAEVIRTCGISEFATVGQKQGPEFAGTVCKHPFYDREVPMIEGFHVTTDTGTGFVHIAPAHGQEDFQIGKEVGLELHCPVQGNGVYDDTVNNLPITGEKIAGTHIWKAQKILVEEMKQGGSLLKTYEFIHSYPVSWRSKAPLIFRATAQWFVPMDSKAKTLKNKTLRERSLEEIDSVNWVPSHGRNRIYSMIEGRPDWCVSRQRVWGVPITIFLDKTTGQPIADKPEDKVVWDHIAHLVLEEGIDAWDTRVQEGRLEELFPAGWLEKKKIDVNNLEAQRDILDVWVDSGTSHAHVVRADSAEGGRFHRTDGKRPADLYVEGSDQHRGWFHSSLLTSVANYNEAPYESVLTNGYVVDGKGRKFSKSLGNGVEPKQLLDQYGMDIIRLWVASSNYQEDVRYSDEIVKGAADAYRRFRNTFRFLLGNLNDYTKADAVAYNDMPELEQYILHRMHIVFMQAKKDYNAYQFHDVFQGLYHFCGTELSNLYFDVRKDALYCDKVQSKRRRACQTVLMTLLKSLSTYLAPLMPFTADEVWRLRFGEDTCVHLETFTEMEEAWVLGADIAENWKNALYTRDAVNINIETLRASGEVGSNVDVGVVLPQTMAYGFDESLWQEIMGVSSVQIKKIKAIKTAKASGHKCERCWTYHENLTDDALCTRCEDAVVAHKKVAA